MLVALQGACPCAVDFPAMSSFPAVELYSPSTLPISMLLHACPRHFLRLRLRLASSSRSQPRHQRPSVGGRSPLVAPHDRGSATTYTSAALSVRYIIWRSEGYGVGTTTRRCDGLIPKTMV